MSNAISRRAVALGLLAAPALAGATSAAVLTEPDPIFAAIEEHRAANMRFTGLFGRHPDASEDEKTAPGDAEEKMAWAILDVEPTTFAGVLAFCEYLTEYMEGGRREWPSDYLENVPEFITDALRRLTAGGNNA